MPEELLLIKTLASVFICVDGLSADGTRNISIFLYNKRTCRNVSPFFVPKTVPKVVFLWFMSLKYGMKKFATNKTGPKLYRFKQRKGRSIQVVFYHLPGKEISTGTNDIVEAVAFAEEYLKRDGLMGTDDRDITLGEYCEGFFSRRDKNSFYYRMGRLNKTRDEVYWLNSQGYVDNYIIPGLGHRRIDSLTTRGIENWILDIKGVKVQELAAGTKHKILRCLRTILDEAVRDEIINNNPAKMVTAPSDSADDKKERRVFTLYEQKLLMPEDLIERIKLWGNIMWASYFSVLADTGMRPGEAMGLRVCDVYRTPQGYGVVAVQEVSTDGNKIKHRVKTSGKGMERRVALLSEGTGRLIEQLVECQHITDDNECLFLKDRSKKDSYIGVYTANKHMRGVLKKLGLEDATQYSFRHTFATYRRGSADEKALALAMGHSGGNVRDDYDHRTASVLISQLEKHRSQLVPEEKNEDIAVSPLKAKKKA